jgi:hypothetical protein
MTYIIHDAFSNLAANIGKRPYHFPMSLIQIRFNTKFKEAPSEDLKWRIVVDGEEFLAKSLLIKTPCFTSEDLLPTGELKYHLSCRGTVQWQDGHAVVTDLKKENVLPLPTFETGVL